MESKYKESTLLALRLVIATIFIYHGLPKIMNPSGSISFFTSIGLPGFSVPFIGFIELVGGILIILGLWHVWATYALAAIMVGVVTLVHIPHFLQNGITAELERDILILAATFVLVAIGPGKYITTKKN